MGNQILRQPDGRHAVFSSVTDTITVYDATEEEIIEYFAEAAAERARDDARRTLGFVSAGESRRAYAQFALSWEGALDKDRDQVARRGSTSSRRNVHSGF